MILENKIVKEKFIAFDNTSTKGQKLRYNLLDISAFSTHLQRENCITIRLRHCEETRVIEFKTIKDKDNAIKLLDSCFELIKV